MVVCNLTRTDRQVAAMFVRTCVPVQGQLSYRLCSALIRERTHWLPNLVTICTNLHMYACVGLCVGIWCVASPTGALGGVIGTPFMYVPDAVMTRFPCFQTALLSCCVGPCASQLLLYTSVDIENC